MMIERFGRSPLLLLGAFVLAAVLGAGLFAAAQAVVPGGIADADRARMERVVRDYLLEHPEILPEAMERLNARQMASSIADNSAAIHEPYQGAWSGNPDGDVTVSVYMDYACTFCRASLPAIDELLRRDSKVRVVYREFPILSNESVLAARWSLAAAEQGKYRAFHDAMFAAGQLNEASILRAARTAQLDLATAREAIGAPRIEDELRRNHAVAQSLGINGTPAWIVGDRVISGVQDFAQLAPAVKAARGD